MASMMDKVQKDKVQNGAYGGFKKPDPSKLTPIGSKLKVLNKADDQAKKDQ